MYKRKLFLLLPVQQMALCIWQIDSKYIGHVGSTKHMKEPLIVIIFIRKEDCIAEQWVDHII